MTTHFILQAANTPWYTSSSLHIMGH